MNLKNQKTAIKSENKHSFEINERVHLASNIFFEIINVKMLNPLQNKILL